MSLKRHYFLLLLKYLSYLRLPKFHLNLLFLIRLRLQKPQMCLMKPSFRSFRSYLWSLWMPMFQNPQKDQKYLMSHLTLRLQIRPMYHGFLSLLRFRWFLNSLKNLLLHSFRLSHWFLMYLRFLSMPNYRLTQTFRSFQMFPPHP
jgi:hypothetical protein